MASIPLKSDNDPNQDVIFLLNTITDTANIYAPIKTLSRKEMKLKAKPWITKGLLKSITTKNKLFHQCYKQQDTQLISTYKTYRNKFTKLKEIAKRTYYQNELHLHKENLSKQWKIINEIVRYKRVQHNHITLITDEHNCKVTDKTRIPDLLNEHFTNVGPNMYSNIPKATKSFSVPSLTKSFVYDAITKEEVLVQIQQLNPKKAPGPENIPIKFLRALATIISPYLSNIFNKCFESGTFLAALKNAKITPIHKARQKDVASNYRPISLISPLSKVFEKLLYIRLEKFFLKNSIISKQQFGFRRGYSTEMAITDLHNKLLKNIDEDYFSCCIFLDLSKAFDTVNHKLLLKKLHMYGIRGNMHDLLASYLTNRKQFTECNNIRSRTNTVVCGVPQGSTLAPLLFSLCINDLSIHTAFHVTLFADDTVLLMRNRNINQLQKNVNHELRVIDDWMKYNRLSLNYSKTNFYVGASRHKSKLVKNFNVTIGIRNIQSVEKVRYLGAIFDKHLSWNAHVDNIIKKLTFTTRLFSTIRNYVDKQTVYYSFAYPHLKYGILAWGSANKTSLKKLQSMQNKIIRIMNFKQLKDKVQMCTLYKSMNILLINDIFELEVAKFMHSFYHCMLPENFDNYFKSGSTQHSYNTRSITSEGYYLERVVTKSGQLSCIYAGVKIWNKIPLDIKKLFKRSFCRYIKRSLIAEY